MNKIIIVLVIVLLGAGIIGGIMYYKHTPGMLQKSIPPVTQVTEPVAAVIPPSPETDKVVPPLEVKETPITGKTPEESPDITSLTSTASIFAQFYGTYASTSPKAQLSSLRILTTAAYATQLSNALPLRTEVRYTTKTLGARILAHDNQVATVEVLTQRTKVEAGTTSTYNQKLKVGLVNEGGSWKVNIATWNETTF